MIGEKSTVLITRSTSYSPVITSTVQSAGPFQVMPQQIPGFAYTKSASSMLVTSVAGVQVHSMSLSALATLTKMVGEDRRRTSTSSKSL